MPRYGTNRKRREYLLRGLREAEGQGYGDFLAEVAGQLPEKRAYWTAVQAARAVLDLLWNDLALVDGDRGIWLSSAGWRAAV